MSYDAALKKAWEDLEKIADAPSYSVSLLGDTYEVNRKEKLVLSNSCNIPAKEYLAILILHYLVGSLENKYAPCGEWVSFKDIEGGEIYYPAYKEGVIAHLLKKYGRNPEGLLSVLERFSGNRVDASDTAIELVTFPDIRVRIIVWKADEEFPPEATVLFDKNLSKLYTMEDISVFSHVVVNSI